MKRAHIITLIATAAVALAAVGTIVIVTGGGASYAAENVPSTCDELTGVPGDKVSATADNERAFDTAAAGRLRDDKPAGTTLVCDWNGEDGTAIQLRIELWTDGDGDAEDSLAEDKRSFAGSSPAEEVSGLGDQAVVTAKGTIAEGAARLGNVIAHARCIFKNGDAKTETIAVLTAALATVGK
ncbi:hypothetical protein [Phytomonospora endophytica]|uniref:DUF3558 domain-containing protein n=1 Tax=Phytomonospora endophytica TaxID=714109 RepID=A0A841G129_9ACTN|nr:hypothetical protein [Phytomonospora endophytica]MBB6037870.1 hypothetical protein [Phytomonospora endophytica]GIG68769.1 hypothetical protein Pen01_50640 [Phytomonospora endophytica]